MALGRRGWLHRRASGSICKRREAWWRLTHQSLSTAPTGLRGEGGLSGLFGSARPPPGRGRGREAGLGSSQCGLWPIRAARSRSTEPDRETDRSCGAPISLLAADRPERDSRRHKSAPAGGMALTTERRSDIVGRLVRTFIR